MARTVVVYDHSPDVPREVARAGLIPMARLPLGGFSPETI